MASTHRKAHRKSPKPRASWRGQFSFGLVSFAAEAFNVRDPEHGDIHFHQIHADCGRRIQHQKRCPVHGEVSNDEIVSGYEYKGGYIEVRPDELDALHSEKERALHIDAFVSPDTIDPIFFDGRMYYLVPAEPASQEPYAVIVEAMEREERHGVGQVVFSGKDQLVLVRPLEGILHMAMLNYEAVIRPPRKVAVAIKKPKAITRQVRLAQTLIEEWSQEDFDFSKYHDTYREKVAQLIEAKSHGRDIVPPVEEEPAGVLDLMEALKKSVAVKSKGKHGAAAHRRSA